MQKDSMITYALYQNQLVHVDSVKNGKKCYCFCTACNQPLVAKNNGPKARYRHHFAHVSGIQCKEAYQTQLHYLAKEIFAKKNKLIVPKKEICKTTVEKERIFWYHTVILERKLNNIVPDIVLIGDEGKLIVEIKVTHEVDHIKAEKIAELNISSLEIDISNIDRHSNINSIELSKILFQRHASKHWIYFKDQNIYKEKILSQADIKKVETHNGENYVYNCPLVKSDDTYVLINKNCLKCQYMLDTKTIRVDRTTETVDSLYCIGYLYKENVKENKEPVVGVVKRKSLYNDDYKSEYSTLLELWINNHEKSFYAINENGKIFKIENNPLPYIVESKAYKCLMFVIGKWIDKPVFYANHRIWKYYNN
jgi:hypothetical protein